MRLTSSSTKVKFVQPWLIKYAPVMNKRYPAPTLMYKDRRNRITHFLTQHHAHQPPDAKAREGGLMAHPFALHSLPRASAAVSHASPRCLLPLHLLSVHSQQLIEFSEELRRRRTVIFLSQDEPDAFCSRRDCRSENTVVKDWLINPEESVASSSSSLPKIIGFPFHSFSGHPLSST